MEFCSTWQINISTCVQNFSEPARLSEFLRFIASLQYCTASEKAEKQGSWIHVEEVPFKVPLVDIFLTERRHQGEKTSYDTFYIN